MTILDGGKIFESIDNAIVTSGIFDGVHFGHQKILHRIMNLAKIKNGKSVVLTFWPHPRFVLNPNENSLKLLSTFVEKTRQIEKFGVDYLIKMPFTKEFSQLSSEDFVKKILIDKIGTKTLVIGYNHHFGKNREGNFKYLNQNTHKFKFKVEEIPRQDIDYVSVSSTKIRKAISEGKICDANEYLSYEYELTGIVVSGEQNGTKMGFPTANIEVKEPFKLIPKDGVFAVRVEVENKTYKGMLNIGFRPTLGGSKRMIETNIFNFNEKIYNKSITVKFVKKLRNEIKFNNINELKHQLSEDKKTALKYLSF